MPLTAAIIGIGGIAKLHALSLKSLGIDLIACCCRTPEKGHAFSAEFGGHYYQSAEALLASCKPDFAIITTPSGSHLEPALACFAHGVHVLCEKPLEVSVERADAMIVAAEEAGVLLGGIFQGRFAPAFQALRAAVCAGHFGELSVLSAQVPWWRDDSYYAPSRWQGTHALDGGGAFINQAIHSLDLLQWLGAAASAGNEVVEVSARTAARGHELPGFEVEDTGVAWLKFSDGTLGTALAATSLYPGSDRRILIGGRDGSVEVEGDTAVHWSFRSSAAPLAPMAGSDAPQPGGASDPLALSNSNFQRNIAAFVEAIERQRAGDSGRFELSGREARRAVALVCAIYQSAAKAGAPVRPAPQPPLGRVGKSQPLPPVLAPSVTPLIQAAGSLVGREVIRWGILGCGAVTEMKSGPGFQRADGSSLTAVMRRDTRKAADYAARHGVPHWYDDVSALLSDPDVDAVYVATPPGSHLELARLVAAAGKPCYMEKPMARSYEESAAMATVFAERGLPLFVAYYRRAYPRIQRLRSLLYEESAIGDVTSVCYRFRKCPPPPDCAAVWRTDAELSGGGLFVDVGSHALDLLDFVFGPLCNLNGTARRGHARTSKLGDGDRSDAPTAAGVETRVAASFGWESGAVGTATWDFEAAFEVDDLEIEGTRGCIRLPGLMNGTEICIQRSVAEGMEECVETLPPPPTVQQPLIATVIAALRARDPSLCPSSAASALRTAAAMDTILEGFYSGRGGRFWDRPSTWQALGSSPAHPP
ncbi:hypothetical protein CYMTET_49743 [Cymbomonas tetramitiformis]|uniref:Oxidoreductase n=1 Tax=Cymbomonas tetramitiformis TaxID=36881 RepID=A0AAE0BR94_9CHLO|nr:hypothetical protein CYMTET_49743 [Cymbomonas tetramitiformis]|eukprot:gene6046-7264_t